MGVSIGVFEMLKQDDSLQWVLIVVGGCWWVFGDFFGLVVSWV